MKSAMDYMRDIVQKRGGAPAPEKVGRHDKRKRTERRSKRVFSMFADPGKYREAVKSVKKYWKRGRDAELVRLWRAATIPAQRLGNGPAAMSDKVLARLRRVDPEGAKRVSRTLPQREVG